MDVHAPPHFVPPHPEIPETSVSWYGFLRGLRTNALQIWPRDAYRKDVLVDNIENYRRTRATIRILRPITGEGLFLSEGDEWRHQRRTIAPTLAPRVIPMLARHIVEVADVALARLDAAAAQPIDMLAAMQFLALEVAARSMFSLEMNRYGPALRRMIKSFSTELGRPYFLDLMLPVGIPSPRDFARMRFRRRWVALMDEVLAARQREPASDQPRDLFDVLLAARDPETGAAFSQAQLRDQMATMIVAGHETTALTMFWSLYLLASAPAEQSRVAQEVADADLSVESAGAALAKLTYTRAVVSESLRLYPPAAAVVRVAVADDSVGELKIPAGSLVMISPWVLHHHTKLWSAPEAFDPSRFLADKPLAHRFAYLPFGAGPRVCVGAQFALAEAALVLAKMVRRFEISLAGDEPVLPITVITTQPDHPALFRLRRRQ
jgi:unspecific monooxygenase